MGFGHFYEICSKTPLPLCSVVAPLLSSDTTFKTGILPTCYARSVELANTTIFQIANAFIHFGAIIVLLIMIFNVRSKYTAIGRSEMLFFFDLFIGLTLSSLIVDCGVSPPGTESYGYFAAVQIGLASACCWCLMFNGFLYFQFWEDGTKRSLLALRVSSFLIFVFDFLVAVITFKSWNTSLDSSHTTTLFVVMYIINALFIFTYFVSQIVLVIFALDSLWPLGAIILCLFFFVVGQILVYVFSRQICEHASHYIDGLFLGTACNLFAVMMVYKYWDMITTDDLEFSVANTENGVSAFEKKEYDDTRTGSMIF